MNKLVKKALFSAVLSVFAVNAASAVILPPEMRKNQKPATDPKTKQPKKDPKSNRGNK